MPHQRKYVPHSGGIDPCPSRAKRTISAYASQGFRARFKRSARWAFVSLTGSSTSVLSCHETQKAEPQVGRLAGSAFVFDLRLSPCRDGPRRYGATYRSGTSTQPLQRGHFADASPVRRVTRKIAFLTTIVSASRIKIFVRQPGQRRTSISSLPGHWSISHRSVVINTMSIDNVKYAQAPKPDIDRRSV